ncbi:MAG: hypothetical protein WBE88_05760, partial [Candidatus Acidiferrales bacterium]
MTEDSNRTAPPKPARKCRTAVPLDSVLAAELKEIFKIRKQRVLSGLTYSANGSRHAAPAPEDAPKHNPEVQAPARAQAPGNDKPDWQTAADTKTWREAVASAHRANLVGVAFSGGGIRSATFNLGVLQGLAEMKLLQRVDYLSTVSGGGYIGGWLA